MSEHMQQIKGQCLYAHIDTPIGTICHHLRDDDVNRIIIRGKDDHAIGFVPLSQILRLLSHESRYLDGLLAQMSLQEIMQAIEGFFFHQPGPDVHCRRFMLLPDPDRKDLRQAFVICEGNRSAVEKMLRSQASCIVAASQNVISGSLIEEAEQQGIVFAGTNLSAVDAAQALLMKIPVGMMMQRFSLHD